MESLPWPAYLGLGAEQIAARAATALRLLGPDRCGVCPRMCKVDRLADQRGLCAIGRQAVVASHFPHFGEEDCLRGHNGSGTIFFSGCNLRCVFCQNFDISWQVRGQPVAPRRLAAMMLGLQDRGCHNLNYVTPEHVVPQNLEALPQPRLWPAIACGPGRHMTGSRQSCAASARLSPGRRRSSASTTSAPGQAAQASPALLTSVAKLWPRPYAYS